MPGAQPSASAISRSDRPAKYRYEMTSRIALGQGGHGGEDGARLDTGDGGVLGHGGDVGTAPGGDHREAGSAAARTPPVLRLVGHDAHQPGPQRRVGPEPVERMERLHERLLDGILGVGGRAGHGVRQPNGGRGVPAHEVLVRTHVPGPGQGDQLGIVHVCSPVHR